MSENEKKERLSGLALMEKQPTKQRGKRGLALLFDEPVRPYTISITPDQAKRLMFLGEDNLSAGVRAALELAESISYD